MSLDPLNHDEIRIFDAVKKSREWREGGTTPLCDDPYCTTGCSWIFRKIIKEALADYNDGVDVHFLEALEPHLREKVKLFCKNRHDLLEGHEFSRLEHFYTALDRRVPEEAQKMKKMEEKWRHEYRQREEAWRKKVEEKREVRKREKQLRHIQRIALKRERDHYYWVAYWAAKHAIKNEKRKISVREQNDVRTSKTHSAGILSIFFNFIKRL